MTSVVEAEWQGVRKEARIAALLFKEALSLDWSGPERVAFALLRASRPRGDGRGSEAVSDLQAGWPPALLLESLSSRAASIIRLKAREIARQLRKMETVDADGNPQRPDWGTVSLALWRLIDEWAKDSTRSEQILARIWRKLGLRESTTSGEVQGIPGGFRSRKRRRRGLRKWLRN